MRRVFILRAEKNAPAFTHRSLADLLKIAEVESSGQLPSSPIELELMDTGCGEAHDADFPFTPGISLKLLSQRAARVLQNVWQESVGKFIDVLIQEPFANYSLFLVTSKPKALGPAARFDTLASRFDFVEQRVPVGQPFLEEDNGQRYLFGDDSFQALVRSHGLSGIRFEEVWSSKLGGTQYGFDNGELVLRRID